MSELAIVSDKFVDAQFSGLFYETTGFFYRKLLNNASGSYVFPYEGLVH